jgi:hypothetical protein
MGETRRLLKRFKKQVAALGLECEGIDTYTPGNHMVAVAREIGIRFLTGFCAPTVINDGHWKITHSGSPLSPYLASDEDYRKPSAGHGNRGFLIASMEHRNPFTCFENWNEGPFCPLNLAMGDRTIEPGEEPLETMAGIEDWIRMSEMSGEPRHLMLNLQWFTGPRCFDLNRACLAWLAEQARMGRVRFVGLKEYAQRAAATGGACRNAWWWRGEQMGMQCGGQAGDGNPSITFEDASGQWCFRTGEAGAERHYDYQRQWKYPPFEPQGLKPENAGYTAVTVVGERAETTESVRLTVKVRANGTGVRKVCLWAGLENLAAPFRLVSCTGVASEATVFPHPGGTGGAVLMDVSGSGTVKLEIAHGGLVENNHSRNWAGLIVAETVWLRGNPVTRLATRVPARVRFKLSLRRGDGIRYEWINGQHHGRELITGRRSTEVVLDGSRSQSMARFYGVTAADLVPDLADLASERARLLATDRDTARRLAPGCARPTRPLAFCREADIPAWIRMAAKNGADAEISAVDAIVKTMTKGRIVAAIHAAADLPFGSKTRVRSEFFNRSWADGKAELSPLYYDYGQAYAPGVAGWNQFWAIFLMARGLDPDARWRVILNLWDPEERGTCVRLVGQRCDAEGLDCRGPEFSLSGPRLVAQGVDRRHKPEAFYAANLPRDLTKNGSVFLRLFSHSEERIYDRWLEGFGFVFLSHVWLVKMPAVQEGRV